MKASLALATLLALAFAPAAPGEGGALAAASAASAANGDDEPVAVQESGDANATLVALSLHGNATCTRATCVALSLTGNASAGCRNATSCDGREGHAPCGGFACAAVAASPLGDAEAYAYCTLFGQVCAALALDRDAYLYECHGDWNRHVVCHGL